VVSVDKRLVQTGDDPTPAVALRCAWTTAIPSLNEGRLAEILSMTTELDSEQRSPSMWSMQTQIHKRTGYSSLTVTFHSL